MVKMGTVWDRTAEFLSDNIALVLPIALLAFFVPTSIEGNFEAALTGASWSLTLILRLVQLGFAVLSLWGSLVITVFALDFAGDQSAGIVARSRLPAAILVSLVLLAGVFVLLSPIPIVLMVGGADLTAIAAGQNFNIPPEYAVFVALYALAVTLLLLWLSTRLFLTTPVLVREKRVLSAVSQSWRLTRGYSLRILGVVLLFALVSWVAMLAAQTVFGSVFTLVAGGASDGISLPGVLTSIAVAAVQTAFTVLIPAFTAKFYLAVTAEAGLRWTVAEA
jgi:hypothetical protein